MQRFSSGQKTRTPRPVWWLLVGLVPLLLLACSVETEVREDSFVVSGSPQLVVRSENGSISVKTDGTGVIKVTTTIENSGRVDYQAVQKGNTVEVTADVKGGFNFFRRGGGAEVVVVVPESIDLDLDTSNGKIEVEGVEVTTLASLETSNGRVTLTGVSGDVKVKTSNGRIDIQDFVGQVEARTSNGSIDFSGTLRSDSENELRTSNGSIDVTLVDTAGVEVDASTSNGKVRSELPITISGETREDRLVGTIGTGGSRLEIHTSNGSITIR